MIGKVPTATAILNSVKQMPRVWALWFQAVKDALNATPAVLASVRLIGQAGSIATTAITSPILTAGIYRVSVYARVTQAASVSSDLTVTVTATESGLAVPQTTTGTMSGNTTTTATSQAFLVRIDSSTSVKYATTYTSVGGTPMQYRLDVGLEQLQGLL